MLARGCAPSGVPDLTIKVEKLEHGQRGPYSDHYYRARITIEGLHTWDRLSEENVRRLVQIVVHPFVEDSPSHWDPKLTELRLSEWGQEPDVGARTEVWMATVQVAFTD